jgi:hypothetical protein
MRLFPGLTRAEITIPTDADQSEVKFRGLFKHPFRRAFWRRFLAKSDQF